MFYFERGQVVLFLGEALNAKTSEIMYSKQFPTESFGLILYRFLNTGGQALFCLQGIYPINIEICAAQAIILQITQSLFHNTFKNILDISVFLEYFICRGDGPYSTSKGRNSLFLINKLSHKFLFDGIKGGKICEVNPVHIYFYNQVIAPENPGNRFYSSFLS